MLEKKLFNEYTIMVVLINREMWKVQNATILEG